MIEIISAVIGLLTSFLPNLLKYFAQRQADFHELEMGKLKLLGLEKGFQMTQEASGGPAELSDVQGARESEIATLASPWVNNMKAIIRPLITISLFAVFLGIKFGGALVIWLHLDPQVYNTLAGGVLDESFMAIFSTVVGFYFGTRSMEHLEAKGFLSYQKKK